MPTRRAAAVLAEAFPEDRARSSIVVLADREDGPLTEADRRFIGDRLVPAVGEAVDAAPAAEDAGEAAGGYPRLLSPFRFPSGDLQVSADGRAALVVVRLDEPMFGDAKDGPVRAVEEAVDSVREAAPPGLEVAATGSAVIGRDVEAATTRSSLAIERHSVWVVIGLLLLVFRAPLPALVPLATMYVAVEIALAGLALMARAGWVDLFDGLEIYTRVLTYGASVDYSVFLIARYREELAGCGDPSEATRRAVALTGPAVAASAGTEIVGIGMLALAAYGKIATAGVAIPLALGVTLLASLTLTFGLMRLAGRRAFWPRAVSRGLDESSDEDAAEDESRERGGRFDGFWARFADWLAARPLAVTVATALLLLPLAARVAWRLDTLNYDALSGLPDDTPSVRALADLQEHFAEGLAGQTTLVVKSPGTDFLSEEGAAALEELTDRLLADRRELGLADVWGLAEPLGASDRSREAVERAAGRALRGAFDDRPGLADWTA